MQTNLQEILELLQDNFPKIPDKSLIKIIYSLKARDNEFDYIGLSRYEADKFGVSERSMRQLILFLRNFGILNYEGQRLRRKGTHLCNYYSISKDFLELFRSLDFFVKKVWEYINPLLFVKAYFKVKFKRGIYKFEINGNWYQIKLSGRFANKIYGFTENKIINPYDLLQT